MREIKDLREYQLQPLSVKLAMTKKRIIEWYNHWNGNVYVSVSGKDSTVLLHIARSIYPDIKAVFVDTGLEYPEVRKLAMSHENIDVLRPEKPFFEVVKEYGYPIISKEVAECVYNARKHISGGGGISNTLESFSVSENIPQRVQKLMGTLTKKGCPDRSAFNLEKWKPLINLPFRISHYCCNIMKKNPTKKYAKETGLKPMTGEMAQESRLRTEQWLKNGCNGFDMKEPKSTPMVFWLEQDVLQYIKENNIEIPSVYGEIVYDYELEGCEQICFLDKDKKLKTTGCSRTGCCFCGFGCYLEKGKTRFQRLKETHPKLYEYCMNGGEFDSEGLWIPNKKGLGLKFVFDKLNEIYGKDFIRYE